MDIPSLVEKTIGIYFLIIALSLIIRPDLWQKMINRITLESGGQRTYFFFSLRTGFFSFYLTKIFILKKYNIELISDIKDFFKKTSDIREALGLNTDEYLIELSGIFHKYKIYLYKKYPSSPRRFF